MEITAMSSSILFAFPDMGGTLTIAIGWISILILLLLLLLWVFVIRPHLESKPPVEGVPMLPRCHWFYGHGYELLRTIPDFQTVQQELYLRYADQYGRTGYWLLSQPAVVLTQAEDVRLVLMTESWKETPFLVTRHFQRLFGPEQLGLLNGSPWKYHRAAIVRSFNPASLKLMRESVQLVTSQAISTLRRKMMLNHDASGSANTTGTGGLGADKNEIFFDFELTQLMRLIGIDSFGLAALSYKFHCCEELVETEFPRAFHFLLTDVFGRLERDQLRPANFFYWVPTRRNRQFAQADQLVRGVIRELVRDHQKRKDQSRLNNSRQHSDLLSNLMAAHEEAMDKVHVSEDCFVDIMLTLLFAGYDSVSNTMACTLYCISKHPDVEANCLREIQEHGLDDPDKLVYLRACFVEGLRCHPPGGLGNYRNLTKPLEMRGGLILPKGTMCLLPVWTISRLPHNFCRPTEYRPDRWVKRAADGGWVDRHMEDLDSSDIPPGDRDSLFGFSAGGRNCPGGKYATQEATIVLGGLLQQLKFTLPAGYNIVPVRVGPVQKPKGGIPVRITIRK